MLAFVWVLACCSFARDSTFVIITPQLQQPLLRVSSVGLPSASACVSMRKRLASAFECSGEALSWLE